MTLVVVGLLGLLMLLIGIAILHLDKKS